MSQVYRSDLADCFDLVLSRPASPPPCSVDY